MSTFVSKTLAMPRKGSSNISAQDLLKLLGSDSKNGFLRQRHVRSIVKTVQWKHKFVILAHNALYVYENEMSKSPQTSIPLLGYVAVERETTQTCAWVFSLVPSVSSLPRRSFACSKDEERRDWMMEIKQHLYTANNIPYTPLPSIFKDKMKMADHLTPEEQMYVELEFPIVPPDESTTEETKSLEDDKFIDDDSDNSSEGEDDSNPVVGKLMAELAVRVTSESVRKPRGQTGVHRLQGGSEDTTDASDGAVPPRYSAIVAGVEMQYQNTKALTGVAKECGLERACVIKDEATSKDRDLCIDMLKKTKKVGTYLIRRSRTQEYKVLSILAEPEVVREYRIEEAYGLFHFYHDKSHEFPTIESLLAYYSHHKPVPSLGTFLGWGIHECREDGGQTYEETS